MQELCTKLNIPLHEDDSTNIIGGSENVTSPVTLTTLPILTTPRLIAPAPPPPTVTTQVVAYTTSSTAPDMTYQTLQNFPTGTSMDISTAHQIIATLQMPPPSVTTLQNDFQILEQGQENRFKAFMSMCERQHQERMTCLRQVLEVLDDTTPGEN